MFQSENGATPVFYAMCHNDVSMVKTLLEHGARLDISMQFDDQVSLLLQSFTSCVLLLFYNWLVIKQRSYSAIVVYTLGGIY